jgi:hypothetical protein
MKLLTTALAGTALIALSGCNQGATTNAADTANAIDNAAAATENAAGATDNAAKAVDNAASATEAAAAPDADGDKPADAPADAPAAEAEGDK